MPDAWESSRGTNPIVDDHTITGPNGYNNLENYLNDLTLQATWNTNADGIWSTRLNWLGNRPTDADATAYFGNVISAPRTITADMPASVGQLVFDSSFGYTLAGASAITMDVISGSAAISVMSGSHIVSAPLSLTHATSINVAPAGSTLTITNLQPTTVDVAKNGSGTLVINSAPAGALAINSGKVKIANPGGGASVSKVGTLSVANFATLDLTKNSLITTSDIGSWNGSAYTGVTGSVQRGRNGGGWSGAGIITSETAATVSHLTTLAVAQAADVLHLCLAETGTWFGQSVSGSDTLIMYTYAGDFDLNGVVNADDYFVIDSNYNKPAPSLNYARGDLNYDGRIDGDDYAGIDASFTAQTSVFPHAQAVPEPSTAVVLVGAAAMSLRRRRRC
jgi:hypothetical protein